MEIADDKEILQLSSNAKEGQPVPNLLFGTVHYLLYKGKDHPLKNFFPSIDKNPKPVKESFLYFKDFCKTYEIEIRSMMKEKMVQTNEVRRCGYLYPAFIYTYQLVKKPLAMIEIETSTGFQLLWDKYSYSYNSSESYGNIHSNVHIQSEIIGEKKPTLTNEVPPITHRYGLDLHINDLSDMEDALWLKGLIWPEHHERRELFEQALASVKIYKDDLCLIEDDGIHLLNSIVEQIPSDSTIVIFHTHVANQIPIKSKHRLLEKVKQISEKRDVVHIYNNIWDRNLHLDYFITGIERNDIIAETDGHGRWFRWML